MAASILGPELDGVKYTLSYPSFVMACHQITVSKRFDRRTGSMNRVLPHLNGLSYGLPWPKKDAAILALSVDDLQGETAHDQS